MRNINKAQAYQLFILQSTNEEAMYQSFISTIFKLYSSYQILGRISYKV